MGVKPSSFEIFFNLLGLLKKNIPKIPPLFASIEKISKQHPQLTAYSWIQATSSTDAYNLEKKMRASFSVHMIQERKGLSPCRVLNQ